MAALNEGGSWRFVVCVVAAGIFGLGCSSSGPSAAGEKDAEVDSHVGTPDARQSHDARKADAHTSDAATLKPIAANQLPPGSSMALGQNQFLYETWGLEELNGWPPVSFMLNLITSEPSVFGNQFSSFGFIPDPNDDLPVGFKRGSVDKTKVFMTCGSCHTGTLPDGRVWLGQPNTALDSAGFAFQVNKRWVAAGNPSMIDAIGEVKDTELGPGRISAEQSETDPLIPDDIPVVYNLSQRGWLSKMGTSTDLKSEVYLSLFGFGAGYPNPQQAIVPFPSDATLATFVAFFGSLNPPKGPAGNASLIAQGKAAYAAQQCDTCHQLASLEKEGVVTVDDTAMPEDRLPGADPSYPRGSVDTSALEWADLTGNPLPPWGDAGVTDAGAEGGKDASVDAGAAAKSDAGDGGLMVGNGFAAYIQFIVAHDLKVNASDGYVVPDLRGLWASAPYLHNGSVETLSDLLLVSSARPTSFVHDGFTVDTTTESNACFGHEFGSTLSSSDQAALVAYLESL